MGMARLIDADALNLKLKKLEELMRLGDIGEIDINLLIASMPTVDTPPADDMKEFAKDVAYQFGYYCNTGGLLCLSHGGLSTLEWAFDILGWENLHPVPECECEIDGCHEHATCGVSTKDGYKWMCGNHCRERKDNG